MSHPLPSLSMNAAPPCSNGDLRLFGGQVRTEGTIEVCQSGLWQRDTICDDDWDNSDARVVCRELGFATDGNEVYTLIYRIVGNFRGFQFFCR